MFLEPGTGVCPVAPHGRLGQPEHFGSLGECAAGEEVQFDHLHEPRVVPRQRIERVVERQDVDARLGDLNRKVVEGHMGELAAPLQRGVLAGVFDQDAAHGLGGGAEEMGPVLPWGRVVRQAQPSFVDERCGLKGMPGSLTAEKPPSQKPEFAIELLHQIVTIRIHWSPPKKSGACDRFSQEAAHEGLEAETMQTVEMKKMNAAPRMESRKESSMMKRTMILMYGVMAYLAFFATICYAIGFVGNYLVPKSVDTGEMGDIQTAVLMNAAMLALFAIQHTIMARRGFKRWVTQYIPREVERSTFVITASLILAGTFYYWRPIPVVLWSVDNPVVVMALHCAYFTGWGLVFASSFLINHFDLFGLRQVMLAAMNRPYTQIPFRMTILYKFVRHPLMLGFLIAFWSSPEMTLGHFLFSGLTTCYILMGIQFEERDLEREHGEKYRAYKANVPMLLPYKGAVREETVASPVTAAR